MTFVVCMYRYQALCVFLVPSLHLLSITSPGPIKKLNCSMKKSPKQMSLKAHNIYHGHDWLNYQSHNEQVMAICAPSSWCRAVYAICLIVQWGFISKFYLGSGMLDMLVNERGGEMCVPPIASNRFTFTVHQERLIVTRLPHVQWMSL